MRIEDLGNSMEKLSTYLKIINSEIEVMEQIILGKETPTKPELISDGDYGGEPVYDMWKCPNCGKLYEIDYDVYDYCPNCGQHIDRSEMDD